jgi:hypothetical protein
MSWLREPLLHFALLGAALFALFPLAAGERARAPEEIVVGAGDVARLAEGFARTWQRAPTEDELAGLVRDHVDEEILYREALALGLERDDTIVRRRLRQKLEFLIEAEAPAAEPADEELQRHLLARRAQFEEPPRISLRHVYLSADRRGERAKADAARLLAQLRAGDGSWEEAGDPIALPRSLEDTPAAEIAALFGEAFAEGVRALPIGSWQGPIASGYGLHLVFVSARSEAVLPVLEAIRDEVRRDWQAERRAEAIAARLAELRARYEVRIETPDVAANGEAAR